jgi:hypothetical protein
VFGGLVVAVVGVGRFSKVQRVPVPCAAVAINAVAISVFIVCFPFFTKSVVGDLNPSECLPTHISIDCGTGIQSQSLLASQRS